mmetsp:Transcript_103770/g.302898  ORF Transcript_103770/g.302898 Transcript_103770/m.302898 type:complete len:252 (-) Transcript_103770:1133-1888(-)
MQAAWQRGLSRPKGLKSQESTSSTERPTLWMMQRCESRMVLLTYLRRSSLSSFTLLKPTRMDLPSASSSPTWSLPSFAPMIKPATTESLSIMPSSSCISLTAWSSLCKLSIRATREQLKVPSFVSSRRGLASMPSSPGACTVSAIMDTEAKIFWDVETNRCRSLLSGWTIMWETVLERTNEKVPITNATKTSSDMLMTASRWLGALTLKSHRMCPVVSLRTFQRRIGAPRALVLEGCHVRSTESAKRATRR